VSTSAFRLKPFGANHLLPNQWRTVSRTCASLIRNGSRLDGVIGGLIEA
jgi:hypothetical protein